VPPGLDRDRLIIGGVIFLVLALVAQLALASGGGGEGYALPELDLPLAFEALPGTDGLTAITDLAAAGDGSGGMFVVEQAGTVRTYAGAALATEPFLDITGRVLSEGPEQGLLSIAFSPTFASDGRAYLYYTARDGSGTLSRFTLDERGEALDSASEEVLFSVAKAAQWHYGGDLVFGPDGALYFGTGDDARPGAAQDPGLALGKLWRLDVDTPGARAEQLARGLRNPWRMSYDAPTGNLFIADVGQWSWEEVNVTRLETRGANFGWDTWEATACNLEACPNEEYTGPVAAYAHVEADVGQCAVVGGHTYRGTAAPSLAGVYLFADHCSGWFFGMRAAADGGWEWGRIGEGRDGWPAYPTTFGRDEAGELFVGTIAGEIFRVTEH